jgi:hypothetical protein
MCISSAGIVMTSVNEYDELVTSFGRVWALLRESHRPRIAPMNAPIRGQRSVEDRDRHEDRAKRIGVSSVVRLSFLVYQALFRSIEVL